MLQLGPKEFLRGEVVDVRFQISVTSESPTAVMIGREIRFCLNEPLVDCGVVVLPALATNVDRQRHHEILQGHKLFEVPANTKTGYFVVYVWANQQAGQGVVQVDSTGGFLQVGRWPLAQAR